MDKIRLEIVGLSYSQTQSGTYALVLEEDQGKRRLPIIIGGFEAQAIAIELEKMTPSRPLTHDLFKSFAESFDIRVKEVVINDLSEGIFFAKLICEREGEEIEIDARTSDAIALAIRFDCPIFTFDTILGTAGIVLEESAESSVTTNEEEEVALASETGAVKSVGDVSRLSDEELKKQLDDAIGKEDYERASILRDELNTRKKRG